MQEAILRAVQPYDLHGVRWYQVAWSPADAPDRLQQARFSHDVIYRDPQPGDRIRVRLLLGVVDRVEKVEE